MISLYWQSLYHYVITKHDRYIESTHTIALSEEMTYKLIIVRQLSDQHQLSQPWSLNNAFQKSFNFELSGIWDIEIELIHPLWATHCLIWATSPSITAAQKAVEVGVCFVVCHPEVQLHLEQLSCFSRTVKWLLCQNFTIVCRMEEVREGRVDLWKTQKENDNSCMP